MEDRIIRVTGRGCLRLRPDTTRLTLTVSRRCEAYADALRRSAEDSQALRDALLPLGFAPEALKTLSFSVDPEYESVQDEAGRYVQRFAGYRFAHCMKLEFPLDNERLGQILFALSRSPAAPEFQISCTVRDAEASKNRLIALAVEDARAKAEVLARAAGAALGTLRSIDYSRAELCLETRPMNRILAQSAASAKAALDISIEPDDIESSDTVTLVWDLA